MAAKTKERTVDHSHIEGAIINGELIYKDIVDGQIELICRFNPENKLVFVNDSYCRYFRNRRQALMGQSCLAFIHEDDREKSEKLLSSLNKKNPIATAEHRVKLPNGNIRWQQWTNRAIFNNQGHLVEYQSVGRDLTERIMAERALRESENNFRALADNANVGITIVAENGMLVYVNNRFSEITGYRVNELCRSSFKDLAHPDELKKISQRHQRSMEGKPVPPCYDTIFVKKDGIPVSVEVACSKTVWLDQPASLCIIRDIALRQRLAEALGKVHNKLEKQKIAHTKELRVTAEKLERKQKELLHHKMDLETANKELVQTNTALSVLARNIDNKRDAVKKKIAQTLSSQIIPLVEELQLDKIPENTRAKLEVLTTYLNDLAPQAAKGHDIIVSLSAMELRVAIMIKNSFSSDDIARLLYISPHTVKTHRRSIRRKLKIKNSHINLASYLKLRLGKVAGQTVGL